MLKIGERVPKFTARTSKGVINFPKDLRGKWVVLYSYVGAFLPSDATDIQELNRIKPKFEAYDTEIVGISRDSVSSTLAWILSMRSLNAGGEAIDIELISDRTHEISKAYGFSTFSDDMSKNEKAVYIIDPNGLLRSKQYYESRTGINVTELERLLLSLKTTDYQFGQTPAGWIPGAEILENPPQTSFTSQTNVTDCESVGARCVDWYICYRQDSGVRSPSKTIENQR